jgi:hypothetical protein
MVRFILLAMGHDRECPPDEFTQNENAAEKEMVG